MAWAHIRAMDALALQLVTWISDRPRTYGEVMEAWRTSCPRLPVWEDAVDHGLVARTHRVGETPLVELTARGRALLAARERAL